MALLAIEDLRVEFPGSGRAAVTAVDGVELAIEPGQTVALVGESGSGKSVTALSVLGLLPSAARVASGRVLLDGRDLLTLRERDLQQVRGSAVAMVFQDPMSSLNPVMTVAAQLSEALVAHGVSRRTTNAQAAELLALVGIPSPQERLRAYPHQLSGGMRQRVMLAMAVAGEPRLLIADEPTTALDATIQAQILELLRRLVAERQMALLLITHDLGVVAGVCERMHVMYAGRIVERGATGELFAAPRHPYTAGLLASVPRLTGRRKVPLRSIEGQPPRTGAGRGCPFAPRCPRHLEPCWTEMPPLLSLPGDSQRHETACWNPEPVVQASTA